jgi:hypothetical protein
MRVMVREMLVWLVRGWFWEKSFLMNRWKVV